MFPGDLVGWSRVQGPSLRCFSLRIWGGWLGSLVRERGWNAVDGGGVSGVVFALVAVFLLGKFVG